MKVTFKVSMDSEAKKAGDIESVTLDIDFEDVPADVIQKAALANRIVAYQSQIRSHWSEYKAGKMPTELKFNENLFTSSRATVRQMTEDEMVTHLESKMTEEEKLALIERLMGNSN